MSSVQQVPAGLWSRVPFAVRAVTVGLLVALPAANVLVLLAVTLNAWSAAILEVAFLAAFLWWTSGGGPPSVSKTARAAAFRARRLSRAQWTWGLIAALAFATTIHVEMVVLYRIVPFPAAAFHQAYFDNIPSQTLKWLAVVIAAASAGICEETGFRGYMQQPLERRYGAAVAIAVSTFFFLLLHVNQTWASIEFVPIGLTIAVLLGLLAWASGSLVPGIIGHTIMDIGLFAYWWTGIAGSFTQRTISVTGVDASFVIAGAIFATALLIVLAAIWRLRHFRNG